jgi:hypothetical protein
MLSFWCRLASFERFKDAGEVAAQVVTAIMRSAPELRLSEMSLKLTR